MRPVVAKRELEAEAEAKVVKTAKVEDKVEKKEEEYRNYTDSARHDIVEKTYKAMHVNQTVDFVKGMHDKWLKFDHGEHTIFDIITKLDDLVDDSDPDTALPNSVHDFQTAERIRKAWPDKDWFHLVGLLHDVGKVLALWGEPQWAVVGDTFPVGCAFSDQIVFPEHFKENKDSTHEVYGTELGMYEKGCGMDKLMISWGHDEYMYQVLKHNGCTLPEEGLAMIRYHSLYCWHLKGAYKQFMGPGDEEKLGWVQVRPPRRHAPGVCARADPPRPAPCPPAGVQQV